jgi:hypothetical protein
MKTNRSLLRLEFDPIVSRQVNAHVSTTINVDRATNSTSLLSNIRRMTIGNLTGHGSFNSNPTDNTPELHEQKKKWMNDIDAICRRNSFIYDEQYQQELDQSSMTKVDGT